MSLNNVPAGKKLPENFNVIIEIPMNSDPVKYEVDKETGAIFVDRFVGTTMFYPCNYGYIPQTIADDGDPLDVLVLTTYPIMTGAVVSCRALGVLMMDDEGGGDAKLLAVPTTKILPMFEHLKTIDDINPILLGQIKHFFEHYKDLEAGKWVKVKEWEGPEAAHSQILSSIERYNKENA
jgi:inorganic pyrophosphatase